MLDLEEELASLIDALNRDGIEYALCGGLALAVHGAPRATVDIDLLVPERDTTRVREVADALGFRIPARPMSFPAVRIERVTKIDQDGETLMLDLLVVTPELEGIWRGREVHIWKGRELPLVSRDGLIRLKMLRASAQDLADIERLKELG